MRLPARPCLSIAALLALTIVGVADAVDPLATETAEAQVQPSQIVESGAPPSAPAGDEITVEKSGALVDAASIVPGTPLAPTAADPASGGSIETGGGLTTNLGGSDVSVSSVGGSHEVDGPKRKAKRIPTPRP
jgi:hypothetical protein